MQCSGDVLHRFDHLASRGGWLATPAGKTKSERRIDLEPCILNPLPALRAVAIGSRHQSIESIVNFSQASLEPFAAFVSHEAAAFEQGLANVLPLSMQAVPDESGPASNRNINQVNCAVLVHD